jgi:hypothetical protein
MRRVLRAVEPVPPLGLRSHRLAHGVDELLGRVESMPAQREDVRRIGEAWCDLGHLKIHHRDTEAQR